MGRTTLLTLGGLSLALSGCGAPAEPPPPGEPLCQAADPTDPRRFPGCSFGSGSFGRWEVDEVGLPAFRYSADQLNDERAVWETSDGTLRRDHLFQLGNDRLVAVISNDGFVQLFTRERIPTFLNRVDLEAGQTGGGYSLIADRDAGEGIWASAYRLRPEGALTERSYGTSQARLRTSHDGVSVTHRLIAPVGDEPFLIDEVTLENDSDRRRALTHYEVWEVARHPLTLQLIRSGELFQNLPEALDGERAASNSRYLVSAAQEGAAVRVSHRFDGTPPLSPEEPAEVDYFPPDIFLARLLPTVEEVPLSVHTRRGEFRGEGGPADPEAALRGEPPPPLLEPQPGGAHHPAILVDQVELELEPGEVRRLRYAYGYAPAEGALPELARWADEAIDPGQEAADSLRRALPFFVHDGAPALHREMAWHAAQLLAAATYDPCLEAHVVVQGSAYMYLHGLDGAARDYALFSLPLTYLRPDLSRELLRTIMRMTYAEGDQISYAVQGCGVLEDAILHTAPSDLDLFFLWALSEYIAASGDQAFLEEDNPFWPPGAGEVATTREHARRAFRHLVDQVGLGPHGLLRVRTGDWSDGIIYEAEDQTLAEEQGESVPNTQMAAWVLPRAASALFDGQEPEVAAEARALAARLRDEAAEEWTGRWYRRAWFGPEDPFGEGHLNLEAQVWALIAEIPQPAEGERLAAEIFDELDRPSPVGARRVPGGMVWHAITGLLTWGYVRAGQDELAWRSLTRHTLAAYAEANPDQWYGAWSGPDALGVGGGTWGSPATPMGDWPVMNANQHALPLLALLRVAGVEPDEGGEGLRIAPRLVRGGFLLELPLLRLSVSEERLEVTYRAAGEGQTSLRLEPPFEVEEVLIDGHLWEGEARSGVTLPLSFSAGEEILIELTAAP